MDRKDCIQELGGFMTLNMIVAICMVVAIVVMLLKEVTNAGISFAVVSIIGALIMGYSFRQINRMITQGFTIIGPVVFLMVFAILYFTILHEQNVFKVLVRFIMKFVGRSPVAVALVNNALAEATQLDGSGATTALCTLPPMRPIYDQMKMRRTTMMIIYTFGSGALIFLPWSPGINEQMAYVGGDALTAFHLLTPVMIFCIIFSFVVAALLGFIEQKRNGKISAEEFAEMKARIDEETKVDTSKRGLMIFDTIVTLVIVVLLLSGIATANAIFALGLAVLLFANYRTGKEQRAYLQRQAKTVIGIVVTMFGLAVYLGVANGTGAFNDLATYLTSGMSAGALIHMPLILCLLVVPLQIFLGNAAPAIIIPAVASLVQPLGVDPILFMCTYFAGHSVATTVCFFSGSAWLAMELGGVNVKDMLKRVMVPCILYSWVIVFICVGMGFIPL